MKSKKLFLALLIFVIVAMGMFAVACEKPEEPTPLTEGPETGTYYYDTTDGEYLLTLNSGDKFTLIIAGESKTGTYNLKETVLTLTFNFEGDKTVTAEYVNGTVKLTYDNMSMEFKRKVGYTVTLNSMGGSSIDSIAVVNGRTIAKPADPTREGYVFAGWYKEEACTTPFAFGTEKVTGNVTLYAKWIAVEVGVLNYTVSFELGYENAVNPESVQTLNGKLYEIDTPARSGYIFGGWWISDSENGDKLTREYTLDTVFTQDTTLYAVWNENATVIMPSVSESKIEWDGLSGITTYSVTVTNEEGEVVSGSASHGSTIYSLDWSTLPAGEYKIEVSGNNVDSVRYYTNKALDRVSLFSVVDSILTFNAVDNAETYYITVECGNENHVHTMLNNGSSTSYNFANCPMVEGGIKFTVVAEADGFASSTSKTFVVNRVLDKVAAIAVNEATETISWDRVDFATGYVVSIVCENAAHEHVEDASNLINIGNKTSYCYKECAGDVTINVYPVAEGYNSPEYTSVEIAKETLATPTNVNVNGTVVTWNEVEDATGYELIVNGTSINVTETSYDISAELANVVDGADFTVSVIAKGSKNSLPSNNVTVRYNAMYGTLKYNNNTVSWRPVAGAAYYEVKVNGKLVATDLVGVNSAEVELTKAGYNTISVCYYNIYDEVSSEATIDVYAYSIYLNPDNGEETAVLYEAIGDELSLPTDYTKNGYTFNGWYNMLGGSKVNAAEYTDDVYSEAGNCYLYADWKANTYTVTFVYGDGEVDSTAPVSAEVVFGEEFVLPTPVNVDATMAFIAWTTEDGVLSSRVAGAFGDSYKAWNIYEYDEDGEIKLYAAWTKAFNFNLEDGGYTVTKNDSGIHMATELRVPVSYKDIQVKVIGDFSECANLRELQIPDSIETVDVGAFEDCKNLTAIHVYNQGTYPDGEYTSIDGVLVYEYDNGDKEVAFVSEYTSGTYVVPDGITVISDVFAGSNISEIVIPASVTHIRQDAFKGCSWLRTVTFEDGGDTLYIEKGAFANCEKLRSIILPARLALSGGVSFYDVFEGSVNLARVAVNANNTRYTSIDAVVFSKEQATRELLFYPIGRTGEYSIPTGVVSIGKKAFYGNPSVQSVIIPNSVTSIGEEAFRECTALTSVTMGANVRTIGDYAFYRCLALKTIDFSANNVLEVIGNYAFALYDQITLLSGPFVLTNVVLPESVITIGNGAFWYQYNAITNLTIPNATSIGDYAFYENDSIKTADIRAAVTIGEAAFGYCDGLNIVTVRDFDYNPPSDDLFYQEPFTSCVNIYEVINLGNLNITAGSSDFGLIARYAKVVRNATDPSTIKTTADGLFAYTVTEGAVEVVKYLGNAAEVVLPEASVFGESVTSYTIGNEAFLNNTTITTITVPAAVTAIGNGTQVEVEYEDGTVMEWGKYPAFYGCTKLATVYDLTGEEGLGITAGATTNGYVAHYATDVYTSLEQGGEEDESGFQFSVTKDEETGAITAVALAGYAGDPAVVVLPDYYVEGGQNYNYTISKNTFSGKTVADLTIGPGVEEIPAELFYVSSQNKTLTTLTINGNGETVIGQKAFMYCTALEKVTLTGVKEIGTSAFAGNVATYGATYTPAMHIKEFTADDSLKIIGQTAFIRNVDLIVLDFGKKVEKIGHNAFRYCSSLTSVTLPASLGTYDVGEEMAQRVVLEKEREALDIKVNGYSGYDDDWNYVEIPGLKDDLNDLNNALKNTEDAAEKAEIEAQIAEIEAQIEAIEAEIEAIDVQISELNVIINAAGSVGNSMFTECTSLENVIIEEGVTRLTNYMFQKTAIKSITLPESLAMIDEYAFQDTEIETIVIPDNVLVIAANAFAGCANLTTVTVGEKVAVIEGYAFTNNNKLRVIYNLSDLDIVKGATTYGEIAANALVVVSGTQAVDYELVVDEEGFEFLSVDGKVYLTGYYGDDLAIVTPYDYNGRSYEIAPYAFSDNTSLLSVVLGKNVTAVGNYAFSNATAIRSIGLNEGLISIGEYAFQNTSIAGIIVPTTVKTIGNYAFYQNKMMTTATINSGEIGANAFASCSSLGTVVIGEGVTSIGSNAFNSCTKLYEVYDLSEHLTITKGATDNGGVARYAKDVYNSLDAESIYVDIDGYKFMTNADGDVVLETYTGTQTKLILPEYKDEEGNVVNYKIANNFMAQSTSITAVTIPDNTAKEIGEKAFYYCTKLETIVIGNSVEIIGKSAFDGYSASANYNIVKKVTLGANIKTIGESAFKNLYAWTAGELDLSSVEEIGEQAFYGCKGITSVVLGEKTKELPYRAFYNCSSIETITFKGPTAVDSDALSYGQEVEYKIEITDMANWAAGTNFTSAGVNPLSLTNGEMYLNGTLVTEIVIPDTVTAVGAYAFAGIKGVTKVTIGSGVTSIGSGAFSNVTGIEGVYVADVDTWFNIAFASSASNPLSIAKHLYEGETEVTALVVPDTVTEISAYAFYGAESITSVKIGSGVTKIGTDAFNGTGLTKVTVADVDAWFNIEFANSAANPLSIAKHLYEGETEVTELTVPAGVTEIKAYAFYGAESITSVTIGDEVTAIGANAFNGCATLATVNLGKNVTSFGSNAFSGCSAFNKLNITDLSAWLALEFTSGALNPLSVAKNLYLNDVLVENLVIPTGVTEIKAYAFYGATGIKSVEMTGVTKVGANAFTGAGLTKVTIDSLASWLAIDFAAANANPLSVAKHLYVGETEVTELTIPTGVTEIKAYAFYGATGITSVVMTGVTKVGTDAFTGTGLTKVTIDSLASWLAIEFANAGANPLSVAKHLYVGETEVTELEIPAGVVEVKAYAFYGAESIIKVTIGADVTNIGNNAFTGTKLTGVYVADLATWLGIDFANAGANPLGIAGKLYVGGEEVTAIVIPDATTEIKDYAFYGAENVTYVILPKSVTKIGTDAFAGCTKLEKAFYMGTLEEWAAVSGGSNAPEYVYNYSETEPTEKGNFWRYVDGVPTPWLDEWVVMFEFADNFVGEYLQGEYYGPGNYYSVNVIITKDSLKIELLTIDYSTYEYVVADTWTATNLAVRSSGGYSFDLPSLTDCWITRTSGYYGTYVTIWATEYGSGSYDYIIRAYA